VEGRGLVDPLRLKAPSAFKGRGCRRRGGRQPRGWAREDETRQAYKLVLIRATKLLWCGAFTLACGASGFFTPCHHHSLPPLTPCHLHPLPPSLLIFYSSTLLSIHSKAQSAKRPQPWHPPAQPVELVLVRRDQQVLRHGHLQVGSLMLVGQAVRVHKVQQRAEHGRLDVHDLRGQAGRQGAFACVCVCACVFMRMSMHVCALKCGHACCVRPRACAIACVHTSCVGVCTR